MLIEFDLPQGASGQAALYTLSYLKFDLGSWSIRYQIPVTQKTVKYIHRVCFEKDEHYTLFAMTWEGRRFRIVTNRNNPP